MQNNNQTRMTTSIKAKFQISDNLIDKYEQWKSGYTVCSTEKDNFLRSLMKWSKNGRYWGTYLKHSIIDYQRLSIFCLKESSCKV